MLHPRLVKSARAIAARTRVAAAVAVLLGLGACATADEGAAVYDRGQQRAAEPVLGGERFIEDAGARITGTDPAYKHGGSFFINPDDRNAFGTN